MPPRPRTQPRKKAIQARSQATVDAILRATARILVKDGYDRASTNRIAQAAGVSIGSLYQYFPSKEALVSALVDEHVSRMLGVVQRALATGTATDLAAHTHRMVDALIVAYRLDPKLHHVLCQ